MKRKTILKIVVDIGMTVMLLLTQAVFHCPPACNAIIFPDTYEGWRIAFCIVTMTCILHDNRTGPGQFISPKSSRAIGAKPCRHPCACRTTP